MRILFFPFFLLLTAICFSQQSVYDFKVAGINGKTIDFNELRGKLIVVVNIASGSERHTQLAQLDTLCRLYAAQGLVVVAFPSNDFNKEPKSNEDIRTAVAQLPGNLLVAARTAVKGESQSPLYKWCTQKAANGVIDTEIKSDYHKFIINREGKLTGFFSGVVPPISEPFLKAIRSGIHQ